MKKTIKVVFCVMLCTTLLFGCGNNNTSNFEQKTLETDDAMTFSTIEWPDTDIARLLPVPKTLNGNITWSKDYGFVIYISGISKEDYTDYNSQCMNAGFNIEQRDGEDFYWADNAQGYHVHTTLDGDVMFIRIDEPEDGPNLPAEESAEEVQEEAESVTEEPIVEEAPTVIEEKVEENLTYDNCQDFANMIDNHDEGFSFELAHEKETIEFDGCIVKVEQHIDHNSGKMYKTRFDFWINYGDFISLDDVHDPFFMIQNTAFYGLNLIGDIPDSVEAGMNIHVVATVSNYSNGFVIISPKSIEIR